MTWREEYDEAKSKGDVAKQEYLLMQRSNYFRSTSNKVEPEETKFVLAERTLLDVRDEDKPIVLERTERMIARGNEQRA
jgi:Mg2+ and Co2+ transporter CorA